MKARKRKLTRAIIAVLLISSLIVMMVAPALAEQPIKEESKDIPEEQEYAPQEILVKFKEDVSEKSADSLNEKKGTKEEEKISKVEVKRLEVPAGESVDEVVEEYEADPRVEFAEPNYMVAAESIIPNDNYYSSYQWNMSKIKAPTGWEIERGFTSQVVVAVVDTGVDMGHPDLDGKIVQGYDFVNDDSNPSDDHGHGTHCAGVIGAETNNYEGVAGVSWGAKIMPVKVLNSYGSGYLSDVASGIIYAADHGAKVISLSLGSSYYSSTLQSAVSYAYNRGAVVVAAAGNSGSSTISYPAGCINAIGVAATDQYDAKASFSSYNASVDIAAPGVSIASTWYRAEASYALASGTSMATPHVAGLAALLLSKESSLSPSEVETRMKETADDLGPAGRDDYFGYGRINLEMALGSGVTNTDYVTSLYQRVLEREPDAAGLAGWVQALSNGMSRTTVAYCFLSSYERSRNYATDMYQNILGRSPDASGLEGWAWAMTYGLNDEVIEACFYGSDEYFLYQLPSATNEQYVTSLYERILERTPLEVEKQMWVNGINGGLSRTTVAIAFINSHEHHGMFVSDLYLAVLGRPADSIGLNNWTNFMDIGVPQRTISAYFYGSSEYLSSLSSP